MFSVLIFFLIILMFRFTEAFVVVSDAELQREREKQDEG